MIPRSSPLTLRLRVCAVAALCAGLLACTGGKTRPESRVASTEDVGAIFDRGRAALSEGRYDEAEVQFAAFLRSFPSSALADEARLRRAQALERAGRLLEAQAALQDDLEKHPTSRFKQSAALELSLVQARLGKPQNGTWLAQMSEEERRRAQATLSEAFGKTPVKPAEGLALLARAVETAGAGNEQEERLAEFSRALEAAPADEVAKLVAELDHGTRAWPLSALKLARIQLHVGDGTHARELAQQILSAQPPAPVAAAAQAIASPPPGSSAVKPNLIGVVLPLTGDLKVFAEPILDAIALRIDLLGHGPVRIEVKDSHNDPDGAARAVEELARDGVIAILGPIGLAEGPAAAVRAQQLGVPMISLSRAENLTQMGSYVFRNMLTNSAQAKAVADYAQKKLNARTFGVLQPDSPYGDEMVRYFWDALDAGGGSVSALERYPRETTTFKPFVARMVGRYNLSERKEYLEQEAKIAKEITDPYRRRRATQQLKSQTAPIVDFDALFIPDLARTVRLIAPAIAAEDVITSGCEARDMDVIRRTKGRDDLRAVQLIGTNLWDSPDLVDDRMGAAKYVQCSIFVDGFFLQSQRPSTQKFVAEYDSAYHRNPGYLEAHGHDGAGILRELIERKHPQTRDELRDLLGRMDKPFPGAAGNVRFGPDREAQKTLFWLWINRGVIQEFDPEGPPPVPPVAPPLAAPAGGESGSTPARPRG
jgi:ABC-type branched-subunit amino acid transport system substrate-binding protein/predicted negative regulator of RcsB-dependent stress response